VKHELQVVLMNLLMNRLRVFGTPANMQPPASNPTLAAFQPVLPSLNTILSHIHTQNNLQAQFQSERSNGNLTDKQEEELHAYDEKISRQVRHTPSLLISIY
jgi:hypothetical protein